MQAQASRWPLKNRSPIGFAPPAEGAEKRAFNGDAAISAKILTMTQKPCAVAIITYLQSSPSPYGGDEGFPDGRYVMVRTASKTVAVVSDPLSNIEAKPESWLNKDFLKVEKIRSIAVAYPAATNSKRPWRR